MIPSGRLELSAVLHMPSGQSPFPVVVACHGLLSSKASLKYVQLAEEACQAGLALLRFDFRSCGQSTGGPSDFTLSGRLDDLRAVIGALKALPGLNPEKIGLMGSSLGGVVAWAVALEETSVKATSVWATPAHLHELLARRDEQPADGPRTIPEAFFRDLEGHRLLELPEGLSYVLIVHGQDDELVPSSHAKQLWSLARQPKELLLIPHADHSLTNPDHRCLAMRTTIGWFCQHLKG